MKGGIVKLIDINDYINPGQSCVKSLVESVNNNIGKPIKKITLDDCLSCTGCITSSETLLVNNCSLENHFKLLNENYKSENNIKLSIISYQSLESLLIIYKQIKNIKDNITDFDYYNYITNIIGEILNIDYIIPLNDFILFTLYLCYKEFLEKKTKKELGGIICSECPGWVCYAEKKIGKISFPYMSEIKSPHEISSIIIKELFMKYFGNRIDINKDLYICSVMSCFDKKIEPIKYKTGINTVISTIELEERFTNYMKEKNLSSIPNKIININLLKNCLKEAKNLKEMKDLINLNLNNNKNNINISLYNFPFKEYFSSNYYIEFFIYMIMKDKPQCYIERKDGKNIDSKEIIIYSDETKKELLFKFLISYGLRNIQNIVRMIKLKKNQYDYVEMMACPGGRINGAGQIRTEKSREEIFNDIKKGFDNILSENNSIMKSINNISQIVEELEIKKNLFFQSFKEADFSKSDFDW